MSNFEYDARRLANDLNVGDIHDAVNVLRQEIYQQPCETPRLINRANQLSSPARRDDIYVNGAGGVTVRDRYTGYQEYAGTIPSYCGRPGYPQPYPRPGYPVPIPVPIPIPFPFPRGGHPHPGHPHPGNPFPHPGHPHPHPGYPHPHPGHPGPHRPGGGHRR